MYTYLNLKNGGYVIMPLSNSIINPSVRLATSPPPSFLLINTLIFKTD
jgi:hypothetical protein